jgi:Protein of unknown function DUF262
MRLLDEYEYFTIDQVVKSWQSNSLRPNLEYQRGATWKLKQQQLLIDSVFRGYPLPRFYFYLHESQSLTGGRIEAFDIIDGLQRIIALDEYRRNDWPLSNPQTDRIDMPDSIRQSAAPWGGKTFAELSQDLQREFSETRLPVGHAIGKPTRAAYLPTVEHAGTFKQEPTVRPDPAGNPTVGRVRATPHDATTRAQTWRRCACRQGNLSRLDRRSNRRLPSPRRLFLIPAASGYPITAMLEPLTIRRAGGPTKSTHAGAPPPRRRAARTKRPCASAS